MKQVTKWVWTATLVLLVGCATAPRVDPEASEKHYLLAADYYSKGSTRPALQELFQAVELNPGNSEAHNLLGIVFLRQAADAEELIERLNCLKSEESKLERQEIEAKFKKAEEQFQLAVNYHPDFSGAWNNLAVVHLHFQHWDLAVTAATQALSNMVYAEPWAAQGNLAWAFYQKGNYLRATKELREALHANPHFCVGRYRLAKVYYAQGNLQGAVEELQQLTGDRTCPIQEAYLLLGQIDLRKGTSEDRKQAAEALRHCVELAPQGCLAQQCRTAQ